MSLEPDRLIPDRLYTTRTDGTCDLGDCPGCQCGAVPAPCAHCTDHWFDMEAESL